LAGRALAEHFQDQWVKQAQQSGLRSRSAYKLIEIQKKDGLIRAGQCVVDLGSAPGGWCQVALPLIGARGKLAIDRRQGKTGGAGHIADGSD
jgi:23S rRNA (uridine2552-2'-O)-methyltransferase